MDFITKENITLLISILGACAWIPVLIDKCKKPKIECRVLKYDWLENGNFSYCVPFSDGIRKEYNGTIFIIYLRIISRNADFAVDDVKIKVKFDSMSEEMDAFVHYSPTFNVNNLERTFYSEMDRNILFCPVLKKDEIYDLETQFIVESKKNDIEYVKITFIDTKENEQCIKMRKENFQYAFKIFG